MAMEHWQPEPEPANTAGQTSTRAVPQPHSQDDSFSNDDHTKAPSPMSEQSKIMAVIRLIWATLFLPVLAVAYLSFCYICHFKVVRIESISDPLNHLNLIKSGVTSISILYVSISLLPIYSLISDLKSEEFFRTLSRKHSRGVPLSSINAISLPSYGLRASLVTLLRGDASGYFATAFIASLFALATSTLTPAVLSVDTILFDGEHITALAVGALTRNSVLNASDVAQLADTLGPGDAALALSPQSGAIAWAEFSLGANVSFQSRMVDQNAYIIPTPQNLAPSVKARWISDVAVLKPTCEWIAPQLQKAATPLNFSSVSIDQKISMNLTSKGIGTTFDIQSLSQVGVTLMSGNWFLGFGAIFDLNTMDDLTNGATAWMLKRCTAGCNSTGTFSDNFYTYNLTFGPDVNSTHLVDVNGQGVDITFLYCYPNAQIETHQISNDGQGVLTVGDKVSTPQLNLHPAQTKLMMSFAFGGFDAAGPATPFNVTGLGNRAQFNLIFGMPSPIPTELSPVNISQISASYARILTSAAKPFVNGSLATAFVPARITIEIPVFVASLSHVIASTVLYVLLAALALGCYFRRHVPHFTFVSIAASLAKSDIPPIFAQLKELEHSPQLDGAVTAFSGARVLLEEGQVLRLRV